MPTSDIVPIWHWKRKNGLRNLGDDLGGMIPAWLSGKPTEFEGIESGNRVYISIGSVMHQKLHNNCVVWGAGFVQPQVSLAPDIDIRAVRGPLSLQLLRKFGYKTDIAVGDPALLLPLIRPRAAIEIKYELGIVPHYVDAEAVRTRSSFESDRRNSDVCVIDIENNDLDLFLDKILSCRFVVSSSLHGLIIAHAYGIPAVWIRISDKIIGGNFKFHDYLLSVSIPPYIPVDFSSGEIKRSDLVKLLDDYEQLSTIVNFDQHPLINSCPFISNDIRDTLLARIDMTELLQEHPIQ